MPIGAAALKSTWQYTIKFKVCVPCDPADSEYMCVLNQRRCVPHKHTQECADCCSQEVNVKAARTHQVWEGWAGDMAWWVQTLLPCLILALIPGTHMERTNFHRFSSDLHYTHTCIHTYTYQLDQWISIKQLGKKRRDWVVGCGGTCL